MLICDDISSDSRQTDYKTINKMEARVSSGGQVLADGTMHTLQPVVVDSAWPQLMTIDPSAATFVPSLNAAAMMMMMMPQTAATVPYPVMFTPNQPADKAVADNYTQVIGLTGANSSSVSSDHNESKLLAASVSTNCFKQSPTSSANRTDSSKQTNAAGAANYPEPPKKPLSPYMRFSKQVCYLPSFKCLISELYSGNILVFY